ncbi:MAG: 4Fe-4S dicluster domain-containing protein, partial [bacterium]|nr:4Fe-4S dicluster domain-containing protein [bacterium]
MEPNDVKINVMGKTYDVPEGLTIMKAVEYVGYRYIRGCGCRGGFCGACATVYRMPSDYKIQVGLACQTVIEDGMYLAQLPFFPAQKSVYFIDEVSPTAEGVLELYPELARCLSCNLCTKVCPQDLEVLDYVQASLRGDLAKAANLSFDCLMCGLCTSRCSAEMAQYNIGLLARRLYGKYLAPKSKHLASRVQEIEDGKFDAELAELKGLSEKEL